MSAPRTPVVADPVVVAGRDDGGRRGGRGRAADAAARRRSWWSATRRASCATWTGRRPRTTEVEPVAIDSPDGLNVLRHSTAHVLAQAVQDLFPEAKLGIGPPIENGFYYDFAVAKPFQPDDLAKLEKRMQEIIKAGQRFRRRRFASLDEAQGRAGRRAVQAGAGRRQGRGRCDAAEVMEVGGGELTIYDNLDAKSDKVCWSDLCRGPHLPHHPADRRVQADALGRRVLAGLGEEPAAAAGVRHRLADPGRAQGVPEAAGGGGPARPPQARRRPRPVQLPRRDRLRPGGLPPQGRHHPPGDGELLAAAARGGRLRVRQHPAHHQGRSCSRPPGTCRTTPTPCSRPCSWRARTTTSSR